MVSHSQTSRAQMTGKPLAFEMLNGLPYAVLAVGPSGRILFVNHAAQEFFGLSENALLQKSWAGLVGNLNISADIHAGARRLHDLDIEGCHAAAVNFVPMHEYVMVSIEPENTIIRQGAATRQAIAPAQHLARVLAHEIKNPLSGIRGAAQLLTASLTGEDKSLAQLIDDETSRIARLIDKITVLGDEALPLRPLNLHAPVEQAAAIARQGFAKDIDVSSSYDPSLPEIAGDHDALVQIFVNLFKNASEAGACHIRIKTYYHTAAPVHTDTGRKLPICVAVEDDGTGISQSAQEKLFYPYFTTKKDGAGLGLSVVSKTVDEHGGMISVASHPGKTIFTISLPRSDGK